MQSFVSLCAAALFLGGAGGPDGGRAAGVRLFHRLVVDCLGFVVVEGVFFEVGDEVVDGVGVGGYG